MSKAVIVNFINQLLCINLKTLILYTIVHKIITEYIINCECI